MSDSVRPHRQQPTRLPHPWDSPGKNTGVGCHFLLQCMKVKSESEVTQLCPTLSDPMDCSPPGSSIHGIFQVRVLEWGAIAFSELISRVAQMVKNLPAIWEVVVVGGLVAKSCPTLVTPWTVACQAPLFGIFQARILEWISISFSRGSSQPRNWTQVSCIAGIFLYLLSCEGTQVQSLGWEDPLKKGMATHSSILAWRIPWTEEPGRLQSMESQRVRHDWASNTHSIHIFF